MVFIDIDSYFRGTRECFGARVPDVNIQRLAQEIASLGGMNLVRAYAYLEVPLRANCPDRFQTYDRVIESATSDWSRIRVYDEHPAPRLAVGDTSIPSGAVRVLDHANVLVGLAVDAIDEIFSYEADAFVFVSRENANVHLASRIREITKSERLFVRLYSATCTYKDRKPPIINGTDWLYITQEMYEASRLHTEVNA